MGIESIKVLHNNLLIKLETTKTTIFVTASTKEIYTGRGEVISVGPNVESEIHPGDTVYLRNSVVYDQFYQSGPDKVKNPMSPFYLLEEEKDKNLPKIALINEYDIVLVDRTNE